MIPTLAETLQRENGELRERVAQLEEVLGFNFNSPIWLGLTSSEARVMGALLARDAASKDMIMSALYRNNAKDEAEIKIVDVFICKIRKKIAPYEIEIETLWGSGYRISPPMKAKARTLIAERGGYVQRDPSKQAEAA